MKKYVKKRDIKTLVHFTNIKNLENILDNGLLSRKKLKKMNTYCHLNDSSRNDGFLDSVCCSISHPNYKMFYSLRQQNSNKEWVVIEISSKVLYKLDCTFSYSNAASNSITNLNIKDRKGLKGLKMMFSDKIKEYPLRSILDIPHWYTTDPQAEVLIYKSIPLKYIKGVAFSSKKRKKEFKLKYPSVKMIFNKKYFSYRNDYKFWRNNG